MNNDSPTRDKVANQNHYCAIYDDVNVVDDCISCVDSDASLTEATADAALNSAVLPVDSVANETLALPEEVEAEQEQREAQQTQVTVHVGAYFVTLLRSVFVLRFFIALVSMLLLIEEYDKGVAVHCTPLLDYVCAFVAVLFAETIAYFVVRWRQRKSAKQRARREEERVLRTIEDQRRAEEGLARGNNTTLIRNGNIDDNDAVCPAASGAAANLNNQHQQQPQQHQQTPNLCLVVVRVVCIALIVMLFLAAEIALLFEGVNVVVYDLVYVSAVLPCSAGPVRHIWLAAASFFYIHATIMAAALLCCCFTTGMICCALRANGRRSGPPTLSKRTLNRASDTFLFEATDKEEAKKEKQEEEQEEADSTAESQCAICLGEYESGETVRRLHCGHHFHKECIDLHLQQYVGSCPLCNQDPRRAHNLKAPTTSSI